MCEAATASFSQLKAANQTGQSAIANIGGRMI
jgi:hypothetical protein